MLRVDQLPLWFIRVFAVAFGLIWGSFLNVVIYRAPRDMSVVHPGSRCPACGTPIPAWDNVPGPSWLPFIVLYRLVRGRAGRGLGDAKLLALAGAWFGWPGAAFVLFAGSVQGALVSFAIYFAHGKIEEPEAVKEDRAELRAAADAGD